MVVLLRSGGSLVLEGIFMLVRGGIDSRGGGAKWLSSNPSLGSLTIKRVAQGRV